MRLAFYAGFAIVIALSLAVLASPSILQYLPSYPSGYTSTTTEESGHHSCPAHLTGTRIQNALSFVAFDIRKGDPSNFGFFEVDEFVVKPGSTGHVTLEYFTLPSGNRTVDVITKVEPMSPNILEAFTSLTYLGRLNQYVGVLNATGQVVSVQASTVGVAVTAMNVSIISPDLVRVTYAITIATNASSGAYFIAFWQRCVPSILTVGNQPYNGPLPPLLQTLDQFVSSIETRILVARHSIGGFS